MSLLSRFTHWYFSKKAFPYWGLLLLDCAIVVLSGYLAFYWTIGGFGFVQCFWQMTFSLLIVALIFATFFKVFNTYSGFVRYSTFLDLEHIVGANVSAALITSAVYFIMQLFDFKYIIWPNYAETGIIFVLATLMMWVSRVAVKSMYDSLRVDDKTKKVFIYGIHAGGVSVAKNIRNQEPAQYKVVGFVSPEEDLGSKYLMGVLVRHDGERLVQHMKEEGAEILIVSPLQADCFRKKESLINELLANKIKILMMPVAEEWDGKSDLHQGRFHEVDIEDLLPREKIEIDMEAIGRLLSGKKILITGAAGSIGSEMVKQIAVYNPSEMILVDQAETPMHDLRLMMARKFPGVKSFTIVSSITDAEHMENLFSVHQPDYVFHAAAYKHVPMMEDNPCQAVRNNINGTRIIADLAVKYRARKFVMISTDKAVNPTNVMGCSKRICEIYCQSLNKAIAEGKIKGVTQFVTTRFGNVLGSNGSVIPIFKEQIKAGGPVTVTHSDIIRYFMLIPEACKLVLEAGTMGKGGEIFVFDMGQPVKIVDLARKMINLSGAAGIEIKFTGLRDGEKLYEEVLSTKEKTIPTVHPKILVAKVQEYDYETAQTNEERLFDASCRFDNMEVVKIMKEIVPEFKSQQSVYQALD